MFGVRVHNSYLQTDGHLSIFPLFPFSSLGEAAEKGKEEVLLGVGYTLVQELGQEEEELSLVKCVNLLE